MEDILVSINWASDSGSGRDVGYFCILLKYEQHWFMESGPVMKDDFR